MSEQKRDDGGPASPMVTTEYNTDSCMREVTSIGGMSLRDYFAAKALPEEIAAWYKEGVHPDYKQIADSCYEAADAMLQARVR